jgi:hypothetical protein
VWLVVFKLGTVVWSYRKNRLLLTSSHAEGGKPICDEHHLTMTCEKSHVGSAPTYLVAQSVLDEIIPLKVTATGPWRKSAGQEIDWA